MRNARAFEAKRVCLRMKHTLTSGGECKILNPMALKCTPTLRIIFVQKSQIFKALIERENKHQIGPQDTIEKVLKCKCLKSPHIVHLDLKCMNYDEKNGQESNWECDS